MAYKGKFAPWEAGSTAYGALDDFFSGETVSGPGNLYYGGSKDYAAQRAGAFRGQGDLSWMQQGGARAAQVDAMGMARDAALGRGPSAASELAKQQADQGARASLGMARSGRAGTGSSATRDALFAGAQTQQAGMQTAALARAQEQMAAQQAYAQQAGAMRAGDLGAADSAYGREHAVTSAQLEADVRKVEAGQAAKIANAQVDAQRDASLGGMTAAFVGAIGSMGGGSDEDMKREVSLGELDQIGQAQKKTPEQRQQADAGWQALMQYGLGQMSDERNKREIATLRAENAQLSGAMAQLMGRGNSDRSFGEAVADGVQRGFDAEEAPPDLDPRDVRAWLASQGEGLSEEDIDATAPKPKPKRLEEIGDDITFRREDDDGGGAIASLRRAAGIESAGRETALAKLTRGLRDPNSRMASAEASEAFARARPMAYEYKRPGPGAPPGPQVGFSAQSMARTPAGRAILGRDGDGMLRFDPQKAQSLTMAATADQESRLRAIEEMIGAGRSARPTSPLIEAARAQRAGQQRRMGDYTRGSAR